MFEDLGGDQADQVGQVDQADRPTAAIDHRQFAQLPQLEGIDRVGHPCPDHHPDRVAGHGVADRSIEQVLAIGSRTGGRGRRR